jgi:hypothetical protein
MEAPTSVADLADAIDEADERENGKHAEGDDSAQGGRQDSKAAS